MQTNLNNNFQKSDIGLRIEKLISLLGIKQNAFAEILDVSTGRLSNIVTGRNKPDSVFLSKIAIAFKDDINTAWLLTGEGEPLLRNMNILRSQNKNPLIKPTNDPTNTSKSEKSLVGFEQNQVNEPYGQYQNMSLTNVEIEALKKEVTTLKERIQEKEEYIRDLKEHIQTLKSAKFPTQVPLLEGSTSSL